MAYQGCEMYCSLSGGIGLEPRRVQLEVLSSSRTSVWVKLGLFNAKICNENRRYIHRLIYQINEQDFLCHSI